VPFPGWGAREPLPRGWVWCERAAAKLESRGGRGSRSATGGRVFLLPAEVGRVHRNSRRRPGHAPRMRAAGVGPRAPSERPGCGHSRVADCRRQSAGPHPEGRYPVFLEEFSIARSSWSLSEGTGDPPEHRVADSLQESGGSPPLCCRRGFSTKQTCAAASRSLSETATHPRNAGPFRQHARRSAALRFTR